MKLLTLILFSTLAVVQAAGAQTLARSDGRCNPCPDAPAPQPSTLDIHLNPQTMIENPRGRGLGKMDEEPLPDGTNHPARNVIEVEDVKELRFWQPQSSFKAVFKSKSFWLTEGAAWGAAIADARRNNCLNNAPCGREMYLDALSPMLAITPFHILVARGISPLLGIGACGYVIFRHGRGAVTGVYP